MPLLLTLFSRLGNYWNSLSDGTRDGIISGLVVALVLAVAGLLWKFGKRILTALRTVSEPESAFQTSAQEVKVKVEVTQPTSTPLPVTIEPPPVFKSPDIPRPPVFGFVARRGEDGRDIVERLREELAPEKNQLIVLWGSGGVGKTTLAAEACRALRNTFPGGIAWISADGKPEFGLATLLDEIATHLRRPELRQLAPQPKDQTLHSALVESPTPLIVLDNFETISPPEQNLCAAWLAKRASCPALITSRDEAPYARAIHILAMSLDEAKEFLQKLIGDARKPKAFAELDHHQLIQAADRIPLVMEWLVKQIDAAREPKTVFEDLARGRGDAVQRVFDRSFGLEQTGDDGRATLLALSLFVPDASRDALAEVSGFGGELRRLEKALQQLDELWLIETTQQNQRVSVQGLTRQLALARLRKSPDSKTIPKRFASFFLNYAQSNKNPTAEDYEALETERDNLLAAMDVAFEIEDWNKVTGLAYVLAFPPSGVLSVHGYWDEALRRNEQALQVAHQESAEQDVANFAHNQAMIHHNRGELEEARQLYQESLEIANRLGDQRGIATTLHQLAVMAQEQGDLVEARQLYDQSLKIAKKLGDQTGIAGTLHQLGMLAQDRGELAEARKLYQESLEIEEKLGDEGGLANSLGQLAVLAHSQGKLEEAGQLYIRTLEIAKKLGDQSVIAGTLHELGILAQDQGEFEEARRLYNQSLEINKKLSNQRGIAFTMHELGRLAQAQGELAEARQHYNQSLEINKKLSNQRGVALALAQLGTLSAMEGDMDEAKRLLGEAQEIFEKLGSPIADVVRRSLARVEGKTS